MRSAIWTHNGPVGVQHMDALQVGRAQPSPPGIQGTRRRSVVITPDVHGRRHSIKSTVHQINGLRSQTYINGIVKTKEKALQPDASSAHSMRDMHDAYSSCIPQATAHVTYQPCGWNRAKIQRQAQIGVVIGTSTLSEPNMKDVFSTSHVEGHPRFGKAWYLRP